MHLSFDKNPSTAQPPSKQMGLKGFGVNWEGVTGKSIAGYP